MGSVIIKNAIAGQEKALVALYNANKKTVYTIARCLLPEEQAAAATVAAFQDVWGSLKTVKPATPEDFSAYAAARVAEQCKKRLLQKNPKALRVPHGKNFRLPANLPLQDRDQELDYLLTNLPAVQKYVFVLHNLGGMSEVGIAGVLQMGSDMIAAAIAEEEENLRLLQELSGHDFDSSYAQLTAILKATALEAELPAAVENSCMAAIDAHAAAAAPALKKQKTIKIVILIAAIVCAVLIAVFGFLNLGNDRDSDKGFTSTTTKTTGTNTDSATDPTDNIPTNSAPALDANLTYYADIDITNYGKITVKLDQASAPATCANFVNLAKTGFYDGLTFHRIMEGFMMQGGCPNGTGGGGAEENVVGEFNANGYTNNLSHTRGAISMARSSDYNSASSQFFIVHQDSIFLDGQYACFGYVTEGMDVVDAVCTKAEPTDDNGTIPRTAQPVIKSVTIRTK